MAKSERASLAVRRNVTRMTRKIAVLLGKQTSKILCKSICFCCPAWVSTGGPAASSPAFGNCVKLLSVFMKGVFSFDKFGSDAQNGNSSST